MEYDGRIPKYLVHRMIFWNTANNCLILTFGVCVALLIRILLIKTNPYEQPFSMKQIIKNLGATLFTLDIFILCVFLSRLLKMLISNDLYRYFHFWIYDLSCILSFVYIASRHKNAEYKRDD